MAAATPVPSDAQHPSGVTNYNTAGGVVEETPAAADAGQEEEQVSRYDDWKFKLRVTSLLTCTAGLVLIVPTILSQATSLRPARFILCIYLTFFSGLVCCFEIHNSYIDHLIEDSFGLLYNPVGRVCLLFMMGGMAVGQGGLTTILGGFFYFLSLWTLVMYAIFPDYRQWTRPGDEKHILDHAQEKLAGKDDETPAGEEKPPGEGKPLVG